LIHCKQTIKAPLGAQVHAMTDPQAHSPSPRSFTYGLVIHSKMLENGVF